MNWLAFCTVPALFLGCGVLALSLALCSVSTAESSFGAQTPARNPRLSNAKEHWADAKSLDIFGAKAAGHAIWVRPLSADYYLGFNIADTLTSPVLYRLDASGRVTASARAPVQELRALLGTDDPTSVGVSDVIAPIDEKAVWVLLYEEQWVRVLDCWFLDGPEAARWFLGRFQDGAGWDLTEIESRLPFSASEMTAIDSNRAVLSVGLGAGDRSRVILCDRRAKGAVWQTAGVPGGEIIHAYSPKRGELAVLTKRGLEFFALKDGSPVRTGRRYPWSHFALDHGRERCFSQTFHLAASPGFEWFFIGCAHKCFEEQESMRFYGVLCDKKMRVVGTRVGYLSSRHVYFPDAQHIATTYRQPTMLCLESIGRHEPIRTIGYASKAFSLDGSFVVLSRHTERPVQKFYSAAHE
ncbi:MAG TPA: hypothetical protein VM492_03975 [Sumerlaeia bacterium]|nr:hypothetical protein [Sumerlaeia bacterium]